MVKEYISYNPTTKVDINEGIKKMGWAQKPDTYIGCFEINAIYTNEQGHHFSINFIDRSDSYEITNTKIRLSDPGGVAKKVQQLIQESISKEENIEKTVAKSFGIPLN